MEARYIRAVEAAKMIRKVLKAEFPGCKFWVHTKGSINVDWIDGPTEAEVKDHIAVFSGEGFDGMIDMRYANYAWLLPDNSVKPAYSHGTAASMGSNPAWAEHKPHPEAELIHFGSSFIFTHRHLTVAFMKRVAAQVTERTGWEAPGIVEGTFWISKKTQPPCGSWDWLDVDYNAPEFREFSLATQDTSDYQKPKADQSEDEEGGFSKVPGDDSLHPNIFAVAYEGDWTWVSFAEKPEESARVVLKEMGFHWSRKRNAWYARERIPERTIIEAVEWAQGKLPEEVVSEMMPAPEALLNRTWPMYLVCFSDESAALIRVEREETVAQAIEDFLATLNLAKPIYPVSDAVA